MKEIWLTQGKIALVDDENYEWLNKHPWFAVERSDNWYAVRTGNSYGAIIYMHREIMKTPASQVVDHLNHNGLDNQRTNLRNCSQAQNTQQRKGDYLVGVDKPTNRFRSRIMVNRKNIHLGMFNSEVEAAKAYNIAALLYFGENAKINNVGV